MNDASMPAETPTTPVGHAGISRLSATALFWAYLAYTLIGTHPLGVTSTAARVEGSPLDRVAVLAMVGLAMVVLWFHRSAALALLRADVAVFAVVGFAFASIVWSDYPDLTLRRSILLVFLTLVAWAIAAGIDDLRAFHTRFFVALIGVVLVNLASVVLVPDQAISEIGIQGIYTQKNVAGIVAMIALIAGVTWILGAESPRQRLIGLAGLAPIAFFLLLTRSKTSIGLAALSCLLIAVFVLAEKIGVRFVLAVFVLAVLALAGLLAAFASVDFDVPAFLTLTVGDASFTGRDELWGFALRSALERPWLGHGYGAFWDVGEANDPLTRLEPGTWLGDVDIGTINQAHNGYLELWLHIGLPVMLLAVWTVLRGIGRATASAVSGGSPGTRACLAMLAAVLFLHILHNGTEATLYMRGIIFSSVVTLFLFVVARAAALAEDPKTPPAAPPIPISCPQDR